MSELNTVKVLEAYKQTQEKLDRLCGIAMNAEQKATQALAAANHEKEIRWRKEERAENVKGWIVRIGIILFLGTLSSFAAYGFAEFIRNLFN